MIVKCNDPYFSCLLDTGARINVIAIEEINRLGIIPEKYSNESIICANGSALSILGIVFLKIEIGEIYKIIKFYIDKKVSPSVICGIEFLNAFKIHLKI